MLALLDYLTSVSIRKSQEVVISTNIENLKRKQIGVAVTQLDITTSCDFLIETEVK
jgi:hypothetical protein